MSITRACYVTCDQCHEAASVTVQGADDARRLARRESGFIRTPTGEDFCPRCAGKEFDGMFWRYPAPVTGGSTPETIKPPTDNDPSSSVQP